MKFGDFIKQLRENNGGKGYWSRLAVAERARISDSYLYQLEENLNTKPSYEILKKLAPALKISYEDLMRVAGYLPPEPPQTKTIKIPLLGEVPAGEINFVYDEVLDFIEVNWDFVKDKNVFALRVIGNCLKDRGIFDKDIIIVSKSQKVEDGDIAVVRIEDECTCKQVFFQDNQLLLRPLNEEYKPFVFSPKDKKIEIIGKVIKALKTKV